YFKLNTADNASWGGADNSLMLYKLMQHGDWLYAQAKTAKADASVDSNKSITLAKSLYYLGRMFPEFDTAAAWEAKGRQLIIDSMNAQVYADGSHREQSVGYAIGVADDVLDVYHLDRLNDETGAWGTANLDTLSNLIEANRQFLTPDGKRPGIGDTNRTFSVSGFLKAGTVLGKIKVTTTTMADSLRDTTTTQFDVANASQINAGDVLLLDLDEMVRVTGKSGNTLTVERGVGGKPARTGAEAGAGIYNLGDQPFAKPTAGDVWQLGVGAVQPFRTVPGIPTGLLGERGRAYAMPDSGNYILRSDDTGSATQVTFDAGPKGGSHGHMDLLNFELWSGGRPLIVDPGPYLYDNSADRNYVISTKAHN
ncbi:MAG: alginate lyase family protein, partial [Myxococcales bacterium]